MSKVSVIVISYNEKEYLVRAIESIVSQSCDGMDIEIIIGDDGSNDGSVELIEQIERDYSNDSIFIYHFIMQRPPLNEKIIPSFRVSSVIKKALSIATGDYCVVLSADDRFCDSSKFRTAVEFLESNSDYYSYVSGFRYVGADEKECIPFVHSSFMFWAHLDYFHISCFVFRMIKPDQLLARFCDDTGFVYTILKQGKCRADKSITFEYTQREKSIMHSSTQCVLSLLELMIYQDVFIDKQPMRRYRFATKSRLYPHIKYLYKHRKELSDPRYKHFIDDCCKYDNNLPGRIAGLSGFCGNLTFMFYLISAAFDHYYISVVWRIIKFFENNN